jgi:hypothetical protein
MSNLSVATGRDEPCPYINNLSFLCNLVLLFHLYALLFAFCGPFFATKHAKAHFRVRKSCGLSDENTGCGGERGCVEGFKET